MEKCTEAYYYSYRKDGFEILCNLGMDFYKNLDHSAKDEVSCKISRL